MPKKRSAGEGGVWQEPSGRWRGAISITSGTGKRRRIERYGKTRKEVADKLSTARKQLEQGTTLTKQPTIAALLEVWMAQIVIPHRKPTTAYRYGQVIRLSITSYIGGVRLEKFTAPQAQAWLNVLETEQSAHAAEQGLKVLRAALNVAIKWGYLTRNVLDAVERPRATAQPITPLSQDQAIALLEAVQGHRLEALYSVALALGLRKGEIVALRWDDVDWERKTLRIDSTISRLPGKLTETTPKTDGSADVVPLPDELIAALKRHLIYQREERMLKADKWKDQGLMFPAEYGTVLEPRNLVRSFKNFCKKAGLPVTVRFHDLRHSCATLLIAQGVHLKVVQAILRHRRIELTANLYGHVYEETQRDATGKMFERIRKKEG